MPGSLKRQRAVAAAVIGNVLEWYDFAVYTYLAGTIALKFFPQEDGGSALLSTFMAYGFGFVARPLGGIVLGRLGDTRGRRVALLVTIFLMAGGTVAIGLLPTYESIGLAAPALLVVARLVQGFSAGGDWGTSTAYIVEWAPPDRRGFYASFQQASVAAGLLLGSGLAAVLNTLISPAAMSDWGWRLPFLLGGLLGPVGLFMRRTIEETPLFEASRAGRAITPARASTVGSGTVSAAARTSDAAAGRVPSVSSATTSTSAPAPDSTPTPTWRLGARAFGFTIVWTVSYYILLMYMPTWSGQFLRLSASQALWSNTLGLLLLLVAIPATGLLSDRVGRKPLLLACCAAFLIVPYPVFRFLTANGGASLGSLIAVQLFFALLISTFSGPGPAAIAEIFPTRHRSAWLTAGYALSVSIFGGFAPFISVWLINRLGSPIVHTFYLMAAAAVSTVVIAAMPETAFRELE